MHLCSVVAADEHIDWKLLWDNHDWKYVELQKEEKGRNGTTVEQTDISDG